MPQQKRQTRNKSFHFATVLLQWFDQFGRKNLPWQKQISPYRVWVSEIMLQQTQVTTVIPYFENFMTRFPSVESLSAAPLNDVLHHWTGLGYYARARNLHKTAKIVTEHFKGNFPNNLEDLVNLPGIGRSTAGAILSIAFGKATPILDGNVKRVLSRYRAIVGHYSDKAVEKTLWDLSSEYTPIKRCADYTQAIMDLGATICTRTKPNCGQCPLSVDCIAYNQNLTAILPTSKKTTALPIKKTHFLIFMDGNETLLYKRPNYGLWGGLWSFPESQLDCDWINAVEHKFAVKIKTHTLGTVFRHTFSHFHLDITPIYIQVRKKNLMINEDEQRWFDIKTIPSVGLPAPIKKLLQSMAS